MTEYTKAPFTYQQQLELLESRGLTIGDSQEAVKFLKQVNYYRFSAYCVPFQNPRDTFSPGTTFEKIIELYRMDEDLRIAVFAALTPVEIFLRTRIAYKLSHKYGTFAHHYLSIYQDEDEGKEWLAELEEAVSDSKEQFVQHYRDKYSNYPQLPLWMAIEIISLGSLSRFFSFLTLENRELVCTILEINHIVLKSWLHTITYLRNICAHHGRLWSRVFSILPLIPDKNKEWQDIHFNNQKLFATIAILEWICRKADLPLCEIEPVFEVMDKISGLDPRFSSWMGVPKGKTISWCWEVEE
jgi:abortive infection bacteriophage resistance protein